MVEDGCLDHGCYSVAKDFRFSFSFIVDPWVTSTINGLCQHVAGNFSISFMFDMLRELNGSLVDRRGPALKHAQRQVKSRSLSQGQSIVHQKDQKAWEWGLKQDAKMLEVGRGWALHKISCRVIIERSG